MVARPCTYTCTSMYDCWQYECMLFMCVHQRKHQQQQQARASESSLSPGQASQPDGKTRFIEHLA